MQQRMGRSVLALGNTASVMPTLAKAIPELFVAYPTDAPSKVLQTNSKCFAAPQLNFPLSVSCYKFVKTMANRFGLFHAELGYAVACDAARTPYGVHIHGVTDLDLLFPKTALGSLLKRRYREALAGARYVVCHPAVASRIRSLRADAITMPLPIDTDQFNEAVPPHDFGVPIPIFSPSRMDQWKGHETIWEAIRIMRTRDKVVIFQTDWGWQPKYSAFRSSAPSNVRMIPLVKREEVASYYRGATIVIGQMKIGHFGMTELEAAACGAPVVVWLEDEHTPFIPKTADPQALADAMDKLVEDEGFRRRYSSSCRDFAVGSVGLASVAALFTRVLATSRPGESPEAVRPASLYPGTGLELVGRALGNRAFSRLKTSLIGL